MGFFSAFNPIKVFKETKAIIDTVSQFVDPASYAISSTVDKAVMNALPQVKPAQAEQAPTTSGASPSSQPAKSNLLSGAGALGGQRQAVGGASNLVSAPGDDAFTVDKKGTLSLTGAMGN